MNALDSNIPNDLLVTTDCTLGSFVQWNPALPMFDGNGEQAYLQPEASNSYIYSSMVEVVDVEDPICVFSHTLI